MRDDQYPPLEIPEYGLRVQPHLAKLGRRTLTTVLIGLGLAVVSLLGSVIAVIVYPSQIGDTGQNEVRVAVWFALAMVLLTGYQAVAWYLAWLEWSGKRDSDLTAFGRVSFVVHVVSYVVVLAGMWFMMTAMVVALTTSAAFWLLAVGVLALVFAQIVGATEYLRTGGPSGTVPAHMRRLIEFNKTRNERPDAP